MSPSGFITGDRNRSIIKQISIWHDIHRLGQAVDSDTGFHLRNGAMRNPDAAWVSKERLKNVSVSELEVFPRLHCRVKVERRYLKGTEGENE